MSDQSTKYAATSAADAAKITPRAEFRVFGQGVVAIVQAKMWDAGAQLAGVRKMPAETYILSRRTELANVKVRDGLLDIKRRVDVTAQGYEVFQPGGKFRFPVRREELEVILSALNVEIALTDENYDFDAFLALVAGHPDLVAATVEKVRHGFSVGSVICEFAQVFFNGAMIESACCESEDHAALERAVAALGVAEMPNVNYVRAAKRVVGL